MKEFWSEKAKRLTPYTAGEQPTQTMIKLNTNENAYPPSPKVKEAIMEAARDLRLYPNADADHLRKVIAAHHGVAPGEVFCSNGSDEALAFCFAAFFSDSQKTEAEGGSTAWFPRSYPDSHVRTLDVTYSFYPVWAELFDVPLQTVPLKEDYSVDVEKLYGARGVVLANPNAPTGIALPLCAIEKILHKTNGVVIVDEAYAAFGAESAIPLVKKHKNLVVVRTLSKSHSLAGLRVGYVIADENLVSALSTVKDSFNSYPLDRLAQAGACAAIEDTEYNEQTTQDIIATRAYTIGELWKIGISCLPSHANFIFVEFSNPSAKQVFAALRDRGILVRYFPQNRMENFLRVTIGTRTEMDAFRAAVKEII